MGEVTREVSLVDKIWLASNKAQKDREVSIGLFLKKEEITKNLSHLLTFSVKPSCLTEEEKGSYPFLVGKVNLNGVNVYLQEQQMTLDEYISDVSKTDHDKPTPEELKEWTERKKKSLTDWELGYMIGRGVVPTKQESTEETLCKHIMSNIGDKNLLRKFIEETEAYRKRVEAFKDAGLLEKTVGEVLGIKKES